MADPNSFDLNDQPRAADAVAQIPTSASEVEVRTLASDLEQMGNSGGMAGQAAPAAQAMQVPVALHPEAVPQADAGQPPAPGVPDPAPVGAPEEARLASGIGKIVIITAIVILALLGLFALGYFVLGG